MDSRINRSRHFEGILLGALILDNSVLPVISEKLSERDFLFEEHRVFFRAMRLMGRLGLPITVAGVRKYMQKDNISLPEGSSFQYLEGLVRNATPSAYAMACINALNDPDGQYAKVDWHKNIGRTGLTSGFSSETNFLDQVINDLEAAFAERGCWPSGATPHLGCVADYIECPRLIVIAGSNRQRNFILASDLVYRLVFQKQVACGVFGQDPMGFSKGQFARVAGVDYMRFKSGDIKDKEWEGVIEAMYVYSNSPLYLEQVPNDFQGLKESIRKYSARCEKECASGKDSPAFIFDLQKIIKPDDLDEYVPLDRLGAALQELNELATEAGMPIVVVHQVNKSKAQEELESIRKHAKVVISLESLNDETDGGDTLTIHARWKQSQQQIDVSFVSSTLSVIPVNT